MEYCNVNFSILPPSKGYILQYTAKGVYRLNVNETYKGIISFMIVKMIYCPYKDSTRDIRSNIALQLQEFPRALPFGTSSGEGVYLTKYPSSRPITNTVTAVTANIDSAVPLEIIASLEDIIAAMMTHSHSNSHSHSHSSAIHW